MSKFILAVDANNRTVGTTQAVTTTNTNYSLKDIGVLNDTIRIANVGNVGLYYAIDDVPVTATTNDVYLPPNSVEYVNTRSAMFGFRNIAFITASGTTSINITVGEEV